MMGDLPDFDSMSEDEQLRWLESLAKRQGGDERGFTTEADMTVAEVDPDTVVDEPGYTPYYSSSASSKPADEAPPPESVADTPEPEAIAAPMASSDEGTGDIGDDPMAWLESLAKRQGGDERGFTTAADINVAEIDPDSVVIDEPGYTPYGQAPAQPAAQQAPPPPPADEPVVAQIVPEAPVEEAPPVEPVPAAPMASGDEDMGDIGDDPMAWLESLAKRQGGDERGFTTAADMNVAEIDPDSVVIDEPGYTPYGQAPPPPAEEPVQAEAPIIEEPPVEAGSSQPLADGELPADIDPIKWLESLAKRAEGVDTRGFTTDADMDIPEIDPDSVVIDEPGYTASSSIGTTGGSQQAQPEPEVVEEELVDFDEIETGDFEDEGDWLTGIASESVGDNIDDFLSDMTDDSMFDLDEELELEEEAPATASSNVSSFIGMSDEEVARAQAEGTITPEQELAWLQHKLTQVPDEEDFDIADLAPADVGDAIETDVPDWLAAQMPSEDNVAVGDGIEDDMMSLASQADSLDLGDLDLGDDLDDFDFDLDDDADELGILEGLEESMPAELLAELETTATTDSPDLGDVGDLLAGFSSDDDDWGFALEQDIEIEDISSVPEPSWYTEAIQKADADFANLGEDEAELAFLLEDESPISPALADADVATDGEVMPDWLQDIEPTIEEDPDLPSWLRVEGDGGADDIDSWLIDQQSVSGEDSTREVPTPVFASQTPAAEQASTIGLPSDEWLSEAREGGYPSWYVPPASATQAEPIVAQQAPPPPKPTPVAEQKAPPPPAPKPEPTPAPAEPQPSAVMSTDLADYVQRLERNPDDHSSRLTFARHLSRANEINESLDQYETLIKKSAELDNVSTELANLIKQLPTHPKARRLLGDVYMRQGRLQEALDTYRGALDKI